ncbi:MAG: primosomal protein DnaI [Granulicatella adiacens]|nr:primosomal protein DnaI [Granulicatella adiacens]
MEGLKGFLDQRGATQGMPNMQAIEKEIFEDEDVKAFLEQHKEELTPEAIRKGMSALLEFRMERDARKNNREVKAPGLEPCLEVHNGFILVNYKRTEEAIREEIERKRRRLIHSINMPKNIAEARFSDTALTKEREDVIGELLKFINSYKPNSTEYQKGLYLAGPFGVGKTYMMGALANELSENGVETTLVNVPTYSAEIKQAIATNTVEAKLVSIKNTPILVLDDIGAEMNSAWFRDEVLMVILQHRMLQELPTFFTSNFTIDQLEAHFAHSNKGDQELLKAKRLIERIRFLAKEYFVDGQNHRNPS